MIFYGEISKADSGKYFFYAVSNRINKQKRLNNYCTYLAINTTDAMFINRKSNRNTPVHTYVHISNSMKSS